MIVIHLIGPGGAGKSTVGPLVAARLGVAFHDLDARFAEAAGDIDGFLEAHGYDAYARRNVETYEAVVRGSDAGVIALSSGFMTYAPAVHPRYAALRERIARAPTTVVLLPAFDRERCVAETVRRQVARGVSRRTPAREEAVIRDRFEVYVGLAAVRVETMRAPDAVADEIVSRLGLARVPAAERVARDLWVQHNAMSFPRALYDHEQAGCDGFDLVLLDADISGCASYAFTKGTLDSSRVERLRICGPIARSAASARAPGEPREHLSRLADLAESVLAAFSTEPVAAADERHAHGPS